MQFEVARVLRLGWLGALVKIVMPATVPAFLLGLRVALPQAIIATLVTEMFTGATGIGGLMMDAQRNFNAPAVFGLLALMGLVGFCLTAAFALLERAESPPQTPSANGDVAGGEPAPSIVPDTETTRITVY